MGTSTAFPKMYRGSELPDVLPTETLTQTGRPQGALRDELYKIHDVRNVFNVLGLWVQSVGVIALAVWLNHPVSWIVAFLLMGRAHCLFAILGHEAAHRLLFTNRKVNDFVGAWFVAYPSFVPITAYRRGHMAHHKVEFGPNEPDMGLYNGYPIEKASWRRKLKRDAFGNSGWKNLRNLLGALMSKSSRPVAARIVAVQLVIFLGFLVAGQPLLYPLLWLLPWMTVWRVINRLRAIAEHGGMQQSKDRRLTTHHVRQSLAARFWIVPFNTGWHLAHHVDIGVPFQNLPKLHAELERSGWVTPDMVYPSYREFWKAASAGKPKSDR